MTADDPDHATIADSCARIRARIADLCRQHGRDPDGVHLIAVTKREGPTVLPALRAAGIATCGENRIDHLMLMHRHAPAGVAFAYVGRVQSRQLGKLLPLCDAIHSLCQMSHIDRLGRACAEQERRITVFLQVNTAGEAQKAGIHPDDLAAHIDRVALYPGLDLDGLMCMAPVRRPDNADRIRACFATARELARHHGLPRLSMGMSGDFDLAIAEGATDVRIGTALFATADAG